MPPLVREVTDERGALLSFLDEHRAAVRRAVRGLTDARARSHPNASELTPARLVEHHRVAELVAGESVPDPAAPGRGGRPPRRTRRHRRRVPGRGHLLRAGHRRTGRERTVSGPVA
ncbi:hypothetical protein ABH917_001686 [Thermobifida halotolerans]|nr:DUF664 domain-containing protein [Thermobifida halotolerans]